MTVPIAPPTAVTPSRIKISTNITSLLWRRVTASRGAALARLYQRKFMHSTQKNDVEVAAAYNFEEILNYEPKIVAELMKRYESLTKS